MDYHDRDIYGMYKKPPGHGAGPGLMGAHTIIGNDVCNQHGNDLGDITEIMLNMQSGKIAYAVLSFGGYFGVGEKLFAVPWEALTLDTENRRFVLKVDMQRLKLAPGFDRHHWPDMADPAWAEEIHAFYSGNH
ncbi:MAG: PRC-barrel domain-containing protein [Collimonas sp.]|uniref:PRC-barrel domain-containing protein n=1 Tax=Collimonas sp. TaxID=1963772 RepID=UPI0032648761